MRNMLPIIVLLIGALGAACTGRPAPTPTTADGPKPAGATAPAPAANPSATPASAPMVSAADLRDTGVPGLLAGLDPDGRYTVAWGPEPDYWLTLTRLDAPDKPEVIAKVATASARVVPGTSLVAFVGVEKGADRNTVYLVHTDGTGLTSIGTTTTPYRLQVTDKGLVAFRSGADLVVYDTAAHKAQTLPGVVLRGEYPVDHTEWTISPDGTRVALLDGQELTLLDLPMGTRRTVPGTPEPYQVWPSAAWSPDGRLFAYGTTSTDRPVEPTLWVASPETAERALLTPARAGSRDDFEAIAWLDNETLLASFVPHGKKPEAYVGTRYYAVSLEGRADVLFKGGSGLFVTADGGTIFFQRPGPDMFSRRQTLWTGRLVGGAE